MRGVNIFLVGIQHGVKQGGGEVITKPDDIVPCRHCAFKRCKRSQTNMNVLRMRMKITDHRCPDFVCKRGAGYSVYSQDFYKSHHLLKEER